MARPNCGCKVCYQYDDQDDPEDDRLERCSACGHIFDIEDHTPEDEEEES